MFHRIPRSTFQKVRTKSSINTKLSLSRREQKKKKKDLGKCKVISSKGVRVRERERGGQTTTSSISITRCSPVTPSNNPLFPRYTDFVISRLEKNIGGRWLVSRISVSRGRASLRHLPRFRRDKRRIECWHDTLHDSVFPLWRLHTRRTYAVYGVRRHHETGRPDAYPPDRCVVPTGGIGMPYRFRATNHFHLWPLDSALSINAAPSCYSCAKGKKVSSVRAEPTLKPFHRWWHGPAYRPITNARVLATGGWIVRIWWI